MDWVILIVGVPAVLVPLVLLFGFAGCHSAAFCTGDADCPVGTECGADGACYAVGDEVDEVPPPALSVPQNLAARAIDSRSVLLTWTDNDPAATGFQIERAEDGDEPQPITVSGTISSAGTIDDNDTAGLQEGVTYVYQVRAQGSGLPDSDPSNISSATVLPATPVSFTATPAGITKINLSWTNASTVATTFSLDRRVLPGGAITPITLPDPTSTTFSDSERTGLVDGTTYEYRVFATVNGVESSIGQLVQSLPAVQSATTPTPAAAFTGTLTTDQPGGEGICLVQRLSASLLGGAGGQVRAQVRLTLRGSTAGSLTLDNVTISQVGNTGDPYDAAPDLTPVASAVLIAAGASVTLPPMNYAFDPSQDLLVAFDISSAANQGNMRFGAAQGADQFAQVSTAEATAQDRSPGYQGPRPNTFFFIEKIEVL
jgi:hypothetical protein